jgi:Mn2+/Fe2+ NRAMP family transporter
VARDSILTAVGGFFDIGNLVTPAQAGAAFRFQLLWALIVSTIVAIFLVDISDPDHPRLISRETSR